MQENSPNARGVILSEEESRNCTIEKHEQLLHNDKIAGRETKKSPLSIGAFADMYQQKALMEGGSMPRKKAEEQARAFIMSQVDATNTSAFKANRKVFTMPELPWKRSKVS